MRNDRIIVCFNVRRRAFRARCQSLGGCGGVEAPPQYLKDGGSNAGFYALVDVSGVEREVLPLGIKGRRDDSGTIQLDFIFKPSLLNPGVYFHVHYFNGFGESLIDYNNRVKKAGIGFTLGNPFASLLNY